MSFTGPLETSAVLRNLIIGEDMPSFDYLKEEFAFRTVFYRGAFSYCICQCGIQHEYLEYIDDAGKIDENIFNHVVACIDKGQCPHVINADSTFVTEARLSPLHVIAASGTSACLKRRCDIINCRLDDYLDTFSVLLDYIYPTGRRDQCRSLKPDGGNLLCLTPFDITVLKNRTNVPALGSHFYVNLPILKIARIFKENSEQCIQFDADHFQKICIQNQNYGLLYHIIDNVSSRDNCILWAIQTAFQLNDLNVIQSIMNNRQWFGTWLDESTMTECCRLAILYNKPEYLIHVLEKLPDRSYNKQRMLNMCLALDREECKGVILAVTDPIDNSRPRSFFTNRLDDLQNLKATLTAKLMATVPNAFTRKISNHRPLKHSRPSDSIASFPTMLDYLRSELEGRTGTACLQSLLEVISPFFISLSDDSEEKLIVSLWSDMISINSTSSPFPDGENVDDSYLARRLRKSTSVDQWLRSLVDVNNVYEDYMTPLLELLLLNEQLGPKVDIFKFRQCLELYIYQNPDIRLNRSAVRLAFEIDKTIYEEEPVRDKWTGTYIVDGRHHGMFGHDADLALNMTVPLLLESGFIAPGGVLEHVVSQEDTIPPEMHEFLQATRGQPKSLERIVRDFLRSYYKGRQLHRIVDNLNLPQKLRDFILLKPLLKSVPKRIFTGSAIAVDDTEL